MTEVSCIILCMTLLAGIGAVVVLTSNLFEQREHLKVRVKELEAQLEPIKEDSERLEWILSWATVEDVGDDDYVPGVIFDEDMGRELRGLTEDMERELRGLAFECTTIDFIDAAIQRRNNVLAATEEDDG